MLSWPNRITVLRLLAVTPFIILLLNSRDGPAYRYGAFALVVLMGIGDAADGIIARRTGKVTRIGSILDPLADKALMISALVLLSTTRVAPDAATRLPYWVSVTLVSRELFMLVGSGIVFLLAGIFQALPSTAGKAATVLQFVTIALAIALPDLSACLPRVMPIAANAVWGLTVALALISWVGYIRMGSKLIASVGGGATSS
jgi:cardiolipin synthase